MRVLLFTALALFVRAESSEEILKKADDIRNPSEAFVMTVSVESNGESEPSRFEVFTKGSDKTLIKTLSPNRDVGRDLLMVEENMWAFIPNLNRAVRVSLGQKLSGQAANGDISRMRWSGDYTSKIVSEDKNKWDLQLIAKKKGLTYEQIKAQVSKKNYHPISAEYLTKSGKVLKRAQFEGYKQLAGAVRPTIITINDAARKGVYSKIEIQKMEVRKLGDSQFSVSKFQSR